MPNGMDYSLLQRVIDGTGMILDTEPGNPDVGTYVTESQLADWIKGKILFTGYYHNGNFYSDSGHTTLLAKVNGALYIDQTNVNKALYACLSSTYQSLTEEAQVQAIIDGLNDGTIVPLKAKQDQNGNVIDQTYETKADASDLKDAIDNNSQRIENLEVAVSGSLVQTNTDATMANTKVITNANEILPWAILKRVGARAVAWNQLIKNGNFEGSANWAYNATNITFAVDGNVATLTMKTDIPSTDKYNWGIYQNIGKTINGHKYLILSKVKSEVTSVVYYDFDNSTTGKMITVTPNVWTDFNVIATSTGTNSPMLYLFPEGLVTGQTLQIRDVNIFDLTTIYGAGNEPSTIVGFSSKFPASYYPYNAGQIIPLNPSEFKVVGWNKWDEIAEVGSIDNSGLNYPSSSNLRSKNYIPVENKTYFIKTPSAYSFYVFYYDASKNFVRSQQRYTDGSSDSMFTPQSGECYVRFYLASSYGTTYKYDICINISQTDSTKPLHNGVYKAYSETTIDTSFTSDYKYVNENCHDYSENVLVNGVMRREEHKGIVGEVDLGELAWAYDSTRHYFSALLPVNAKGTGGWDRLNGICPLYLAGARQAIYNGTVDKVFATTELGGGIWIADSAYSSVGSADDPSTFLGHLQGVMLNYEKATPSTPTLHDPIPNIPCEDGTTVTAVTPQTDLVNSIDVPSTIAYMTKIGG